MNRRARRAAKIAVKEIDSHADIQVDAKFGQIVMILANARGHRVVDEAWPDVEWTTDEIFSRVHSPDRLFTHIRVTRLPPHLERRVPLAFASPDALGFAVAYSLQRRCQRGCVIFYSGLGPDITANKFGNAVGNDEGADTALFAEYVPAGTRVGAPESVN